MNRHRAATRTVVKCFSLFLLSRIRAFLPGEAAKSFVLMRQVDLPELSPGTLLHDTSPACMYVTMRPRWFSLLIPSPTTPSPAAARVCPGVHITKRHTRDGLSDKQNVLRCSGTPRISGKLFTGLSVGRTAALCIIVIQTGRQMHAHTPATRWAHSPVLVSCRKKKRRKKVNDAADAVVEALLRSAGWSVSPSPSPRQASSPRYVSSCRDDVRAAPCRAILEWIRQTARSIQRCRGGGA